MEKPVIVAARRTAVGRFQGGLASIPASKLGAEVVKDILAQTKVDPNEIDEVIMGNVIQAGQGQNPARQAAIWGGIPPEKAAMTVNKVCGSGLKSIVLAAQAIKLGDAKMIIAGGMETMRRAPYLLFQARDGYRLGHGKVVDSMVNDGLWDIYNDFHMGNTGELVADKYKIPREAQDEYAYGSHQKALAAQERGDFKDEIVPVSVPQRKGDPVVIDTDEGPRKETTLERLAKLKPAFKKDGSVTPGNASSINDGAAAVLVASESRAKELGLPILAYIDAYDVGGMEPEWVMMAPVKAVGNLLNKTGEKITDFDLVELNEAFSVQAIAVSNELEIPKDRINVNGGAVAIGHPIGCSGARILVTLLHAMKKRDAKKGLASLCLGGGNAVAMSVSI
ncbi:MAG: acetyl-CoA C-acetyltransferase [Candidatus Latescibacterota bacterium]|nr:MAG: acetyl-CoA C-acetyltransferase [Candidatus Latescibacterota bacterium]